MSKHRVSTLISMCILGGIILSMSCSIPFQLAASSKDSKNNHPAPNLDAAVEIVINEVVQPEQLDHPLIVFTLPEPLSPGDEIGPYNKSGYEPHKVPIEITEDTWFFWIDDAPVAEFMHSTRFVFIAKESGQITVSDEQWWPVLNSDGLWTTRDEYWDETNWAFSNTVYRPGEISFKSTSHLASAATRFRAPPANPGAAIVINGWEEGESGEENFAYNSSGMHDALDDSGFDVTYLGPPQDNNPDRDGEPTAGNRLNWFIQKAEELQPGDTLVVFISGHGGVGESGIGGVGPVLENFLQEDLERFDPGVHIIVIINGCSSGSFVDSISKVADVTITATGAYDPSYGDLDTGVDPNPDDKGSEFVSGFYEDWNEIMADDAQQEEAQRRAEESGTNFWEEVSALSYLSALEKDAAYLAGMTFPQAVRGGLDTRPTPSPTPTITPTPGPTASALSVVGKFLSNITLIEDEAEHYSFIGLPKEITLIVELGSIRIKGPFPWVSVSGEINPEGVFDTSGRGTVAGYPNIKVTFQGSISGDNLEGNYIMGASGGLPQGKSITYGVSGERVELAVTATPDPMIGELQDFANSYNANFQAADVDGLLTLLHPAVLELYGVDACQEYLFTVVEIPIQIQVLQVLSFESWLWEIDGRSTLIEDIYSIQVGVTTQGQTIEKSMHLGRSEDGNITWFTDCGQPLP